MTTPSCPLAGTGYCAHPAPEPVPLPTLRLALKRLAQQHHDLRAFATHIGIAYGTLQPFLAGTSRHRLTTGTRYRLRRACGLLTIGEQVVERFKAGESPRLIAQALHLDEGTIYHALRQALPRR